MSQRTIFPTGFRKQSSFEISRASFNKGNNSTIINISNNRPTLNSNRTRTPYHEESKYDFMHNPFSMPQVSIEEMVKLDPEEILAYQYDFVCNGIEMASGAVRNHDIEIMKKVFEIAGYKESEIEKRFQALYEAFKYGAPPHAGMAPGIDRILMMLLEEDSIRETIAFPLSASGADQLMNAPSEVTELQLRESHIKLR